MTFNLTKEMSNILYQDILITIDEHRLPMENFEYHQKITKKLREEVSRIFNVIQTFQNGYDNEGCVGSYILSWIRDERDQREFDEYFEIEDEYPTECEGYPDNEISGECYCRFCN